MDAVMTLPAGIVEPSIHAPGRWQRTLLKREVFELDATRRLALSCLDGVFWVTRDRDPTDYVLKPGTGLRLDAGDRVTIQALSVGRFGVGPL